MEIQEERDAFTAVTLRAEPCRTRPAPEPRKSQHDTTAPGSAQRRAPGDGPTPAFHSLGSTSCFRDTVALFQ